MINLQETYSIITYLVYLTFLSIFIEYLYSLYKKDGVYSKNGTISNTLNGIFMKVILNEITLIYFGYFIILHNVVGYDNLKSNFSLISFIGCLLILDLSHYIYHIIHHRLNFLWMFHRVHHGDDKFNLSTNYRLSWAEKIWNITTFIPALILGFNPYLIAACYILMSVYQVYSHDQYIKFPKFLEIIFITPRTHRVHHDQETKHQNSNFGAVFSIWDRMFGTYVDNIDSFTPGIKGYKQDNFIMMQLDPIVEYFKEWKTKR